MVDEVAPIEQIGEAVAETVAAPTSIPVLVSDLELAHKLAEEVKAQLANKHEGVMDIFKWLLNLK
jgi:hypothetical protein